MEYVIGDEVQIEYSIQLARKVDLDFEIELPIITISNEETPVVTPLQVLDYGSSSIEVSFEATTERAEEVVKGVLCGTTNPPTFENADYRLLHGQGSMDLEFAGLHVNTEYYLRSYALSNLGYKYGDVIAQRTKASPIPDEYQLVEWIQSTTGQQYINTDVNTSRIYRWFMQMSINATPQTNSGSGLQTSNAYYRMGCLSSGRLYLHFGAGGAEVDVMANDQQMHQWEININDAIYRIDNKYVGLNISRPSNGIIYLFIPNGVMTRYIDSSIYECEFGDVNGTIQHLYSVYRKSDNKPGMYDIVGNQFYTNSGTGEFIVGPDKDWEE